MTSFARAFASAICPEAAAGLGVPRPPVQLVVRDGEIRALGVENGQLDVTQPLIEYGRQWVHEQAAGLCGFIFKSRSPSCGLGTTPIRGEDGEILSGNGLFVQQFIQALPHLPVIDEEALESPQLRLQFLQRVDSYVLGWKGGS